MIYSMQHYENVARHLDGENISLDGMEQKLLDEVRGDLQAVAKAMDTTVDSDVIDRVLRRHRKSPWRAVTGLTAAAAVVMIAFAAWVLTANHNPARPVSPTVAMTNEVVENLATVQAIMEAQQELDIITILVQNDNNATQAPAASTSSEDDAWDMNAWANDLAG